MPDPVAIVPRASSEPWEVAHDLTDSSAWLKVDPLVIIRVKNALECEPTFLALLGWEKSVDLWFDDWPVEKRRYVVDKWFEFERLKGKITGYERFLSLVDVPVRKAITPPQGMYPSEGWTDTEREAWLGQFQQIRIYPYVPVTEFASGFYACDNLEGAAWGFDFFEPYNAAIDSVVREARIYDPDTHQETVLTRREMVSSVIHVGEVYDFEDIILPARDEGFFFGDYLDESFIGVDNAPERVIRAEISRPYNVAVTSPQYTAYVPDGETTSILPELVRETFEDAESFYGEHFYGPYDGAYFGIDVGWQHVYERFYLFDRSRDRAVVAGEPGDYWGEAYFGWMPFTAELKVEVRGRIDPDDFSNWIGGYIMPDDQVKLGRALEAVRAAKAARDTIYLDTQVLRTRRFGDRTRFGDRVRFGALVETI